MTTPDSSADDPLQSSITTSDAPLVSFRAAPPSAAVVSNCAKSIIDRKLRKYASETSFATETASESSLEREIPSRTRVFTVKPVKSTGSGGTPGKSSAPRRSRHDSDASGSANSEATVASGANTPRRCRHGEHFRRPKSAGHVASGGEMHQSCTSATIHSLESHLNENIRRASNVYMMDDDSIHEFEDDDGGFENWWILVLKSGFLVKNGAF
ncbi:unnamed protein product [Caenorhabditis angaria]|uniref:Uncharacterized protein n=1 Tax=Caenorhabditis angaria TaxID=860376 RepID=A0A9P1MXN1_9PELO|nr:unnamed protein product [Caenorhabditis angaria]